MSSLTFYFLYCRGYTKRSLFRCVSSGLYLFACHAFTFCHVAWYGDYFFHSKQSRCNLFSLIIDVCYCSGCCRICLFHQALDEITYFNRILNIQERYDFQIFSHAANIFKHVVSSLKNHWISLM